MTPRARARARAREDPGAPGLGNKDFIQVLMTLPHVCFSILEVRRKLDLLLESLRKKMEKMVA